MAFHQPDPDFLHAIRAKSSFRLAIRISLALLALLWFILIVDNVLALDLNRFGLRPRELSGLIGIVTAPLLHGGAEHLFNNSFPLLVALTATLFFYPNASLRVIPIVWLGSGLLGWFIGRPSLHVGASGVLYGLLAFVFASGVIRRDLRSVAVSLVVWFLYGTLIWGVFPIRPNMSWELHLSGGIVGVLMAFLYRGWDRVAIKRYSWEQDDSIPEWYPEDDGRDFELPDRTRKDSMPVKEGRRGPGSGED